MSLQAKCEEKVLTVCLEGRIDSNSVDGVEKELTDLRAAMVHDELVLDVENLEYISSAGLRMILRARKAEPDFKVINANTEVYEIFDMTGFTEMLTVEKAYRKFSVDGCKIIGQGANGTVYRYDPETIIKVYKDHNALPDIQRERDLARKAFVLGIPTAIPYDIVKVGEQFGSVFELLNAKSFADLLNEEPEKIDEINAMYVDLLKKIHSTEVKPEDMPSMKEVAQKWVKSLVDCLPKDKYDKLKKLVNEVPEVHTMLHGDYHVKNVMLQNGEVLLIDMDTLRYGHPVFELGCMHNDYLGFSLLNHENVRKFVGIPYEISRKFYEMTIARYLGTNDEKRIAEVEDKIELVGYLRLLSRLVRHRLTDDEPGRSEASAYKQILMEKLDKVDSLTF